MNDEITKQNNENIDSLANLLLKKTENVINENDSITVNIPEIKDNPNFEKKKYEGTEKSDNQQCIHGEILHTGPGFP